MEKTETIHVFLKKLKDEASSKYISKGALIHYLLKTKITPLSQVNHKLACQALAKDVGNPDVENMFYSKKSYKIFSKFSKMNKHRPSNQDSHRWDALLSFLKSPCYESHCIVAPSPCHDEVEQETIMSLEHQDTSPSDVPVEPQCGVSVSVFLDINFSFLCSDDNHI